MNSTFEIVKKITNRIISELGALPSGGEYIFEIITSEVDGHPFEFPQSTFYFELSGREYTVLNMSSDFVIDQHKNFLKLRSAVGDGSDTAKIWKSAT